jgi:hypothetical protein
VPTMNKPNREAVLTALETITAARKDAKEKAQ